MQNNFCPENCNVNIVVEMIIAWASADTIFASLIQHEFAIVLRITLIWFKNCLLFDKQKQQRMTFLCVAAQKSKLFEWSFVFGWHVLKMRRLEPIINILETLWINCVWTNFENLQSNALTRANNFESKQTWKKLKAYCLFHQAALKRNAF